MKHPVPLIIAVFAVAFSLSKTTNGSADDSQTLTVTANNVILDTQNKSATVHGNVKLSVGDLKLSTEEAIIVPTDGMVHIQSPLSLAYKNLLITGNSAYINTAASTLVLEAPSVSLSDNSSFTLLFADQLLCNSSGCRLRRATGTACPHFPKGYEIKAESVEFHPSGDLDLVRPSLLVEGNRVLILPWLRLRPPNKAGFLAPRLGYDSKAGFIFGPSGHIPIPNGYHLDGHVAVRTSQGLETSTSIMGEHLHLKVDHLFNVPKNSFHLNGHIAPPLAGADLTADLDYATSTEIKDALTFDPLERASTHLENRLLVSAYKRKFALESQITYLQSSIASAPEEENILTPTIGIGTTILPLSPSSPVWAVLHLDFNRRDIASGARFALDSQGGLAPAHSKISASPQLIIPFRLGIFSVNAQAATLHEFWLPDGTSDSKHDRHLASAAGELSLPLMGHLFGLRHILTPLARYRITPWINGDSPTWKVDSRDQIREGHGLEISVSNRLGGTPVSPHFNLTLTERFDLTGFNREFESAYLHLESSFGPTWLHFDLETSWDHQKSDPSYGGIEMSSFDDSGTGFALGGNWYGAGRGPHTDAGWNSNSIPWMVSRMNMETDSLLELFETATLSLTKYLSISGGTRIGVHPVPRFHAIWYGVAVGSKCGCISLGLNASHRLNTYVPDVMAILNVGEI